MRFLGILAWLLLLVSPGLSALAGEGLVKRQLGGWVTESVSSHGHVYIGQGSTLVTLAWGDQGVPAITSISAPVEGWVRHLVIDGDTLWVSAASELEQGRLYEFSLLDSASPRLVGEWRLANGDPPRWGIPKRVGDLLYVGGRNGTLAGYRLAQAGVLEIVFELALTPQTAGKETRSFRGLEAWPSGHLLAITERRSNSFHDFYMLDISDPSDPVEIARLAGRQALDYARHGDQVALVGLSGYQLIDWSDPHDPQQVVFELLGSPMVMGATFEAGHLIGYRDRAVVINDASDPAAVELLATLATDEAAAGMVLGPLSTPAAGFMAFVTRHAELLTIDLSDPLKPRLHHILNLPQGFDIRAIRQTEDLILVVSKDGLTGMSEDLRPRWRYPASSSLSRFSDVVIGGEWIALANRSASSLVMRLNGLEGVEQLSAFAPSTDRFVQDGELLWSVGLAPFPYLKLFDMTNPSDPDAVALDKEPFGEVRDMARKGSVIYLADRDKGIAVTGFTSSDHKLAGPTFLAECRATAVDVDGDLLAAACLEDGLRLYDVSIPAAPQPLSRVEVESTSGEGLDIHLDDGLLWYSHYRGVELLDVGVPDRPLVLKESPRLALVEENPSSFTAREPYRSGRLSRSASGGMWVATGPEGMMELNGVSPLGPAWTGPWHDPSEPGRGFALEVLSDDLAAVTWFEYDSKGEQEWFQGLGLIEGHRIEIPEVYKTQGGAFADPDAPIDIEVIGSARLAFHDCDTGVVEMEFESETRISLVKPLTRTMQIGCRLPDDARLRPQSDQTGLWHAPDLPGQGVSLTWIDTGRAVMNWFTYDLGGNHVWIQGVGDMENGRLVFGDLYTTTATRHGIEYDPELLRTIPWGEAALDLACLSGEMTWNSGLVKFGSGSMQLKRLTIPAGLECDGQAKGLGKP